MRRMTIKKMDTMNLTPGLGLIGKKQTYVLEGEQALQKNEIIQ